MVFWGATVAPWTHGIFNRPYLFPEMYAKNACSKEDALALMEEVYNILRCWGVYSTEILSRGVEHGQEKEWTMNMRCWVSAENSRKPALEETVGLSKSIGKRCRCF